MAFFTVLISYRKLGDSLCRCVKLLGTERVVLEICGSIFVHSLRLRVRARVSLRRAGEIHRFRPKKAQDCRFWSVIL